MTRRPRRKPFTRTRCPQCCSELRFSDDEMGDDVIDEHIRNRCRHGDNQTDQPEEGVDE